MRWHSTRTMRVTAIGLAVAAATSASLSADRLQLRSGKIIDGSFAGGDASAIRFVLADGSRVEILVADVTAMELAPRKEPPPPPPRPKPAATPPAVTVPTGTVLNVRLTQRVEVDAAHAGMTFRALVDDPVMMHGNVVIPRGASATVQAVRVEQSGTIKGSDKITLKLNAIAFGGRTYDVATTYVEAKGQGEGKRSARKIGGGVGLGAIIGGIAGGGEGAAIGAAVGGATGAVVASQGQEHLELPAETRLQFQLSAAVSVRP